MDILKIIYYLIQVSIFNLIDSVENRLFPDPEYQQPPFEVPISLKEPGEILSKKVKIQRRRVHHFHLDFQFQKNNDKDRERVRNLIGYGFNQEGKPLDSSIQTPVLMTIYKIDGDRKEEVYRYQADGTLFSSVGANDFSRYIGYSELLPGHYLYQLVLLHAVPEFNEVPVSFRDSGGGAFQLSPEPNKCNKLRSNYQSCQP